MTAEEYGEPEAVRRLLSTLVNRFDEIAAAFVGGNVSEQPAGAGESSGAAGMLNLLVVEALELLSQLVAGLIAVLETVSAALDGLLTSRRSAPGAVDEPRSRSRFEEISVEFGRGVDPYVS